MIIEKSSKKRIPVKVLAFTVTKPNTGEREPVPEMAKDLFGQLFGDHGYISQKFFEELYERCLKLITKYKRNMKIRLVKMIEKVFLRKRTLIETTNE